MGDLARSSTALLTDQYELTMVQAALESGKADRQCLFEVFGRHLPPGRRYGVVAGTGRVLEALKEFTFGPDELGFLKSAGILNATTLDWLESYEFTGDIRGYAEGDMYFPNSPILTVKAPFAQAVVLETLILSIMNYDTAVASAASRMSRAAGTRPCADMGSRRTSEHAAVAAARAAVIAGFASTSNLEAGRTYGLNTIGTAAHAFTLLHDSEREAFAAQVKALGTNTVLLLDTYDVDEALTTAIDIAGPNLGGVRIDSGDLGIQAAEVREKLDALGATNTKITVTSDLDEYAIASLRATPTDYYGVGTRLVTGSGFPTAHLVYKLVAHSDDGTQWTAVHKKSTGKTSHGGFKQPVRALEGGVATEEAIGIPTLPAEVADGRPLHVDLVRGGQILDGFTGHDGVMRAREHYHACISELPRTAHRLQDGESAIPTVFYTEARTRG